MAKGRRILNDNIRKDMKRLLQALANADNPSIDTLEHAEAIAGKYAMYFDDSGQIKEAE